MNTQHIATIDDTIRRKGSISLYLDKYDNSETQCLTGIIDSNNKVYDVFTINLEKYNLKPERGDIFIKNTPKNKKYVTMLIEQEIIKQVAIHIVNKGEFICTEYKLVINND